MNRLKLNIQYFADGKVVIDTELNTKNFESGLDKMKRSASNAGSTIKNIAVGLGITKLVSTAIGQINGSIDGAIERLDTLNNFPKVMSNLGIGSEDAEASIKKMSDKLAGLPTTLDQGAAAVQRFTSSNGDVRKSTDLFLSLNNAILAGGAPTELQSSALEQLSQAYAKGRPDMMEWRTAMSAMPAQLKQVALAMGYVNADELGEALRSGEVSMDQFMDTIAKLNTEGVNGFQSFEEQAKNSTSGIQTAITVAKTQVVKGVTDIISALNTRLEDTQFGSLAGLIQQVGVKSKEALDLIAGVIKGDVTFKEFSDAGLKAINNLLKGINNNIPQIIEKAGEILSSLIDSLIENLPLIIETGMQIISNLIIGISQQLPTLIPKAVELVMTIVMSLLDNIDLIIDAGIQLLEALADGWMNALPQLIDKMPELIDKVIDALVENLPKLIEMGIKLNLKLAEGLIKAIPQLISKIPQIIASLVSGFGRYVSNMLDVGKNIVKGIWNGISNSLSWIKDKISGWIGNVIDFIKDLFGIASPSKVMRDEVGVFLAKGLGVGFDKEIDDVYKDMQKSINFENAKIQANVESGKVFNSLVNNTPVVISLDASVDMDGQKVGRLVTPSVARTIKAGGGY